MTKCAFCGGELNSSHTDCSAYWATFPQPAAGIFPSPYEGVAKGQITSVDPAKYLANVNVMLSPGAAAVALSSLPILTPYANNTTGGVYCLPEENDWVWVGFEQGSSIRGYVLGSVYDNVAPGLSPNVKQIRFQQSQIDIILDDDSQNLLILMKTDAGGVNGIKIGENGVNFFSENGDIKFKATGSLTINAKNEISAAATKSLGFGAIAPLNILCAYYDEKALWSNTMSDFAKMVSTSLGKSIGQWYIDKQSDYKWEKSVDVLPSVAGILINALVTAPLFILPFTPWGGFFADLMAYRLKGTITLQAPIIVMAGATMSWFHGLLGFSTGQLSMIGKQNIVIKNKEKVELKIRQVVLKAKELKKDLYKDLASFYENVNIKVKKTLTIKGATSVNFFGKDKVDIAVTKDAIFKSKKGTTVGGEKTFDTSKPVDIRAKDDVIVKGSKVQIG